MSRKTCTELKKDGTPCRGTAIEDGKCIAHRSAAAHFDDPEAARAAAKRSAEVRRQKGALRRIEEYLADNPDRVIAPLLEALQATKHVVVGNGPSAHVEEVPDIPTRLKAAAELMDRGYGKPRQRTELTGADGQAITFAQLAESLD